MDAPTGDVLKTGELVDNFLDIDEALQSYLVSLNERSVSEAQPMQQQQQQQNDFAAQYDLNPSPSQAYLQQQYTVAPGPGYFQPPTPNTQNRLAGLMESKVNVGGGYENGRTRVQGVRTVSSGRNATQKNDLKHSQVQEKNRIAQKRFRERQKAKITELHQQINALEQRVDQLMMENTSLQSHNSLLEKVLAMRDEHIKLVQQQQVATAEEEDRDVDLSHRRVSLNLTAIKGKEVKLSTENLKTMTPKDVMQIWHTYVTEISSALVEYNSQAGGSTKRIEELIDEVSKVFMRLSVMNPMLCKVWQAREYHTSEIEELKRWQSALGQLNFSDSQKMELVQLRRLYLEQLQGLVDERKKLHLTIQTMLVSQTVSHKLAKEYLNTNHTVMRLRDILRLENNAMLQFCSTIIHKIMRPEQVATLMVHSYPQKPDLLALTSAIAMDIGENITVSPETPSAELPTLPDVLSGTASTAHPMHPAGDSMPSISSSHAQPEEE